MVVNKIQQWFFRNNLIINTDKTKVVYFHNYQNKHQVLSHLSIEDRLIPISSNTRFLGLHVNENLKWNHHCDLLKLKLNTGYYLINFLQKVTHPYVTRSLYFACFHPHLKYGITLWGGDPHSVEIFKLQKKVIRVMCKVDQLTSCRHLFQKLRIFPLPCLFISEMVCWIKYFRGKLICNSDLYNYDTRHNTDLHALTCRTNIAKDNGLGLGIKLFNKLPNSIKILEPKHKFKTGVNNFLLEHVFYSLDEFLTS